MPANEAIFRHGFPVKSDHTPAAQVYGGQVIVMENLVCIAHRDCAVGEMGAVAVGGGVYEVAAKGAYDTGTAVYWDDTVNQVSNNSADGMHFGFIVDDTTSAEAGDLVNALHWPSPNVILN
jgi:predicted RecA/RadA family phage recombinase